MLRREAALLTSPSMGLIASAALTGRDHPQRRIRAKEGGSRHQPARVGRGNEGLDRRIYWGVVRYPVQRTSSRERPGEAPGVLRFYVLRFYVLRFYRASSSTLAKQATITRPAPARLSTRTQASDVAPLVMTSSTSTT